MALCNMKNQSQIQKLVSLCAGSLSRFALVLDRRQNQEESVVSSKGSPTETSSSDRGDAPLNDLHEPLVHILLLD